MDTEKVRETNINISNEYSDYLDSSNLHLLPERKLLGAVLERAILDLKSPDIKLKSSAEDWFNEPLIENPALCTFQHICNELDLDPLGLKEKIITHILMQRVTIES